MHKIGAKLQQKIHICKYFSFFFAITYLVPDYIVVLTYPTHTYNIRSILSRDF